MCAGCVLCVGGSGERKTPPGLFFLLLPDRSTHRSATCRSFVSSKSKPKMDLCLVSKDEKGKAERRHGADVDLYGWQLYPLSFFDIHRR